MSSAREAVHRLLRGQPGPALLGGRAPRRQPPQRLLATSRRLRADLAAARPERAVGAARARLRAHERRVQDDEGEQRAAPRRLRGRSGEAGAARRAPRAGDDRLRRQVVVSGGVRRASLRAGNAGEDARRHTPLRPAVDLARERRRSVRRAPALVPRAGGRPRLAGGRGCWSTERPRPANEVQVNPDGRTARQFGAVFDGISIDRPGRPMIGLGSDVGGLGGDWEDDWFEDFESGDQLNEDLGVPPAATPGASALAGDTPASRTAAGSPTTSPTSSCA
jgi:hypothetical protein